MSSPATSPEAARRSTRVRAQIPFRVSSLDPAAQFNEQCHTIVINAEGCGVRFTRFVQPGTLVLLDELPAGNTVRARVSNCVPLGATGKYWLLGIELEQRANVWCIQPTPADWGTAPAPAAPSSLPKKKDEWPYAFFSTKGEAHPGRK